jgi:GTPase SAR1 family protein
MVGDQSSGKTSVVEALVGQELSHKDSTMATRRPLLLSLIRTGKGQLPYAVFKDGEKLYDFEMVRDRVTAENQVYDGDVSSIPVEVTVHSPDVFDTVLIDLPGFIMVPEAHQDPQLPDQIEKMNDAYLQDPVNILCVVSSATADPATSMALREATKADR